VKAGELKRRPDCGARRTGDDRDMKLTYATRRSPLALAQCRAFVARLKECHPDLELEELLVVTAGDRIQDRPLAELGGKGLFVKEIEEALLEARADLAVHSIKDVPGILPNGLRLACVPAREDPRDVLVAPQYKTLVALPRGARVGTGSLRRKLSLIAARPDIEVVPIRGNVDTRLRKIETEGLAGIVLARAGLVRLGLADRATEVLSPEVSLPAIGQGALGVEIREADTRTRDRLAAVNDAETATCVAAERGVLIALGGDCKTPIAAHADRHGGGLRLRAFVADADETRLRRRETEAPWPASEEEATQLGMSLGRLLA
jgi:hydroxymethylbilane synthase